MFHTERDGSSDRFRALSDYISTHTPHAGRDVEMKKEILELQISTHTPHAGRDVVVGGAIYSAYEFLLTRPMRGATDNRFAQQNCCCISTHTPHAGRDVRHSASVGNSWKFLLTRPMRGATACLRDSGVA